MPQCEKRYGQRLTKKVRHLVQQKGEKILFLQLKVIMFALCGIQLRSFTCLAVYCNRV